ncbi:hypothetical protein KC887_03000 [Candidatus Kaiserbacteria bacterium]|nr:hypothetical protein [Candidatus Kaiserbacteria bacterium]
MENNTKTNSQTKTYNSPERIQARHMKYKSKVTKKTTKRQAIEESLYGE